MHSSANRSSTLAFFNWGILGALSKYGSVSVLCLLFFFSNWSQERGGIFSRVAVLPLNVDSQDPLSSYPRWIPLSFVALPSTATVEVHPLSSHLGRFLSTTCPFLNNEGSRGFKPPTLLIFLSLFQLSVVNI